LRRSVPKDLKLRVPRKRNRITGHFLKAGEKEPEPWQIAEQLIDRFRKKSKNDLEAFSKAYSYVLDKGWADVEEALQEIEHEDRAEPKAWLVFSESPEEPATIGRFHDDTEGAFRVVWHGTGGYRGYYQVFPSDPEEWTKVHADNILAYSEDAEHLASFDSLLREAMDRAGIPYVRVTARSSNVFSVGYDLFVDADWAEHVESLINMIAPIYRHPGKYFATALTGKDPGELTKEDIAFLETVAIHQKKGEPIENKREMLRESFERLGFDPGLVDRLPGFESDSEDENL
jgi:hypothetical protein